MPFLTDGFISFFWKYPLITLTFITFIEIAIYFDRGAVASVQETLKKNWNLSSTEQGAIASVFTIGFMCMSPIWAHFGMRYRINRVISIGLLIFSMGAIGCGIFSTFWRGSKHKNGYYYFTAMRFVIGIGESSIISLGYTIVNDLSPIAYKTVFMGIILVAAPVGVACGYGVTGGVLSFTSQYGAIFFVEGIFVTLCAIFCWFVPMHDYKIQQVVTEEEVGSEKHVTSPMIEDAEIELKSQTHEKEEKPPTIFQAIWPLFTNPVYVGIVLYSNVNGAILGALTFWCPSFFMYRLHNQDLSEGMKLTLANLGFAVIVLIASLVGTALGSIIVDKTGGVVGWKGIAKALFISTGFVGISIPWLFFGLVIETMHWVGLYILSFISIFFLMATTSPFQVALIAAVPPNLRHYANSFQIFFLHALGDLPSPFIFGAAQDALGWMWAMVILWSILIPGFVFMGVSALIAVRNHKVKKHIF